MLRGECWLEKSKIVTKIVTSRPRNRVQICVHLESCLPHSASYFGLGLGFYNDENFPNAEYMVGTAQTRYCKGGLRKANEPLIPHSAERSQAACEISISQGSQNAVCLVTTQYSFSATFT